MIHKSVRRMTDNIPFAMIPHSVSRDMRLRRAAKGLLLELLSRPPDWEVHITQLIASGKEGKDAVYGMIRELIANGYIFKIINRDQRGRVIGVAYEVYSSPQTKP